MLNSESSVVDSNISELTPLDPAAHQPTIVVPGISFITEDSSTNDHSSDGGPQQPEYQPLERSSSVQIINNNHFVQISDLKLKETVMDDTKRIIFRVVIDVFILICGEYWLFFISFCTYFKCEPVVLHTWNKWKLFNSDYTSVIHSFP